jgi:hypothetical protein
MLQLVWQVDTLTLPLSQLAELAHEELAEDWSRKLHIVIHRTEVSTILNVSKERILKLWFDLWSERYSGASIIRSVNDHTDVGLPPDEAFILIVTHVEGGVRLHVWKEEIPFIEWQILYFDPHLTHGVDTDSPNDNATVVRVTVKKK